MLLSFEGNVQKNEAGDFDSIQLAFIISLIGSELRFRLNMDRILSAVRTIESHAEVWLAFSQTIKQVKACPNSADTEAKDCIENSVDGRRILVQKQIVRGRQSAGLRVAFWAKADTVNISLWRRNVPRSNPMTASHSAISEIVPELCLMACEIQCLDFGLEYSAYPSNSTFIGRLSTGVLDLKIAQFQQMLVNDQYWQKVFHTSETNGGRTHDDNVDYLVTLVSFGPSSKMHSICLRIQLDVMGKSRALAVSCELDSGALYVDLGDLAICLVLAAEAFASLIELQDVLKELVSARASSKPNLAKPSLKALLDSVGGVVVSRVILTNTDVKFGHKTSGSKRSGGFSLHLEDVRTFLKRDAPDSVMKDFPLMLSAATSDGEDWSRVISMEDNGGAIVLTCGCCSQLLNLTDNEIITEIPSLIAAFDGIKVDISLGEGIRVRSIYQMEALVQEMSTVAADSAAIANDFYLAVSTWFGSTRKGLPNCESVESPMKLACRGAVAAIQSVKQWFHSVNHTMSHSATLITDMLENSRNDMDNLHLLLFAKEKARLSSLARSEPEISGWLRIGAARTTGQRGLLTATMWPHWAVLRKSILFLYLEPSDVRAWNQRETFLP
jgi:hypothetical protein